jgi:mRNA interferase MazF
VNRGDVVVLLVESDAANGLTRPLQVMIDKIQTVRRERIGKRIGRLDDATLLRVTRSLAVFLGFA